MNYRQVTQTFLDVARQYEQDMTEASNYYEAQKFNVRMQSKGLDVDARDFIPMVALMGIKGNTPKERAEDIHAKMEELASVFEDEDKSKRNEYLDLIYYLVDDFGSTFDPVTMNMNNPAEVEQLLKSMLIEQTVGTKRLENPDYFNKRYPTVQSRNLMDARNAYRSVVGSAITTNLYNNGIVIDVNLSLPKPYRNEAGEMQYEARTIRVAVTPEQETLYMQQFSWVRRTLFNWGPFRIEPLQERMDRIANDPQTDERLAGVIANHKERIETRIAQLKEAALQSKQNSAEFEQHKGTYNEARDQLEATTTQWDKESVIGILGQQITATYVLDGAELSGACAVIRKAIATTAEDGYEKMAIPFAKVVLYTQLCSERAANGGRPGELEQALGIGNNIQENIENTAQNLAKDQIFQNLVLKKIGEDTNGKILPSRTKFERMIISGGYNGFWMEYKQNLKEMGNRNEQQVLANEDQLANQSQKQQDMQKSPI